MDNNQITKFFSVQRQIFGICPNSKQIFRLSDCNIYLKKKPEPDWLQKIEASQYKINLASERLDEKESEIREKANEKGRREADKIVKKMAKKVDKVFNPLKLNPNDSKVIFHPVDYIVFNGKSDGQMKNIILIDGKKTNKNNKQLQKSIDKVVEKEKYEWITLRVEENGNITEE
jgi:predicted Holliday junction resolvase-like endonuclease